MRFSSWARRWIHPDTGAARKPLFAANKSLQTFLLVAIVTFLACSCSGPKPLPANNRLYLPECLIIQTNSLQEEPTVKAYKDVLDTVALNWRVAAPAGIEKLAVPEKRLILIIPMRAARSLSSQQIQNVLRLVENGAVLVTEGITPLSQKLGFLPGKTVRLNQLEETAYPEIEILWEAEEQVTLHQAPGKAVVLNRERTSGAPMVCMLPRGQGNCLVLAAELNPKAGESYLRFPYFLQELQRAGVSFPFRSERLSALFDYAYRLDENPDALAAAWKEIGIRDLHVGAWYFCDDDRKAEAYLHKLIEACHRNGILVYAWLELPHVSAKFWEKHPEWREKTATGRDAEIDWRLVMNLNDPRCFQAVASGLEQLFRRFDWDGVNLGELYFDSPSGKSEPGSFTPLNSSVRSDFKRQSGIDPIDFFRKKSPNYWEKNASGWQRFVDYRVELEKDLHERFIRLFSGFRSSFCPNLDVVVTYVDNIYDPNMREAVGADVSVMFGLLDRYDFTLVLEDPGTVWHLGPRRYAELAQTYSKMTRHAGRLGIDINIIERDVQTYPTQKQTGTEFLQLFCQAGRNFQTVMAYSEMTMLQQDARLVSFALAANARGEMEDRGIRTSAPIPIVYRSGLKQTSFDVDGNAWPCVYDGDVSLPAGSHLISTGKDKGISRPHLVKLNGDIISARYGEGPAIEFSYNSPRRAIALFDSAPKSLQVDNGAILKTQTAWVMLPRGSHKVRAIF